MQLVEKHNIGINHRFYEEIDKLSFLSKNLYNSANFYVRQAFIGSNELVENKIINNRLYINYYDINDLMVDSKNINYNSLPRKVSQQVLKNLDKNWKSFFASIKDWKINPNKYEGRPKLPKYKKKDSGRNLLVYTNQAINIKDYSKTKLIQLSGTDIKIKSKIHYNNIDQVRIIPKINSYIIEVIYNKEVNDERLNKNKIAGIDLGVNNLLAITSNQNEVRPLLINGRPLKAINQYYNKELAKLNSKLDQDFYNKIKKEIDNPEVLNKQRRKGISRRIRVLTDKRNNRVDNYLHTVSKMLVDYLIKNDIGTLIIGKNRLWKTKCGMNKISNQNFINIPHAKLIQMIDYKCQLIGNSVLLTEESYTSKCSFIDMEEMKHKEEYLGQRIKRGLFVSKSGIKINADCNGSGNTIRKVIPNAFMNGIEGVVVHPVLVNPIGYNLVEVNRYKKVL